MKPTSSSNQPSPRRRRPTAAELERKLLLTAAELAVVLGVGEETCREIRRRDDFPRPIHNGFYSRPQVMRWLDGGTAQAQPEHFHGDEHRLSVEEETDQWLHELGLDDNCDRQRQTRPTPASLGRVG